MEEQKDIQVLRGTVEEIVYRSVDGSYTVLTVDVAGEPVVMVGEMFGVMSGEEIEASGRWTVHKTYGEQFEVEKYESTLPATTGAVMRFLSDGMVKGLGEVTARNIVEKFGDATLDVIEHRAELLAGVRGMNQKKAAALHDAYVKWGVVRELCEFFMQYGISPHQAPVIYKVLGPDARERILSDPYILCDEPILIPFETADAIADDILDEGRDALRRSAAIKHVLRHNLKNGHTFLPRDTLRSVTCGLLDEGADEVEAALDELLLRGELMQYTAGGYEAVYLPHMLLAEAYIASRLMLAQTVPERPDDVSGEIDALEKEFGIRYAPEQRQAVSMALERGVLVLTGGPGTGKTTILKAIIRILKDRGRTVLLAAPTGRAAKRMQELCGVEAKTIHRLLEIGYARNNVPRFGRNEKNPLRADYIILDECSMIDTLLFEAVLRAMPYGCRLVLSGDADQLPSIGPGNVLRDIISSGCVEAIELKTVFRQAQQSLIVMNAHRINEGAYPELGVKDSDFFFLPCRSKEDIAPLLISLCRDRLPKAYGISGISGVQVITPTRKNEGGTVFLNRALQNTLNPPSKKKTELVFRDTTFRVGDKVMQIKNDYDILWKGDDGSEGSGAFNGDVGEIIAIDRGISVVDVHYEDRLVTYTPDNLDEIELAYAVTVHKSQGSEFPIVILALPRSGPGLMTRNLLYTAVTRAKDMLIITGDERIVYEMVDNNRQFLRYSSLCPMLQGEKERRDRHD